MKRNRARTQLTISQKRCLWTFEYTLKQVFCCSLIRKDMYNRSLSSVEEDRNSCFSAPLNQFNQITWKMKTRLISSFSFHLCLDSITNFVSLDRYPLHRLSSHFILHCTHITKAPFEILYLETISIKQKCIFGILS